jgi:hypothetical protein
MISIARLWFIVQDVYSLRVCASGKSYKELDSIITLELRVKLGWSIK